MDLFIIPLIAFVSVAVLIPVAIKCAPALKLVDLPDGPQGRKRHEGQVPLIGGLIIFPVFIILSVICGFSIAEYWPLYSAILVLLVTGAIDDKRHIRPWIKFLMQFVAAALIIFPGQARIHQLGDLLGLGAFGLEFAWLPFSFIAVVLLINAINLMDGLDGLAAGISGIALTWFAIVFYMAGDLQSLSMVSVLIAAIVGFLIYNLRHPFRKRASLFLGDAGSLCLGLCLAWFAVYAGKNPMQPALAPIGVAWVLAIPIMDTCAQFYRRMRLGQHPFTADRGHFHHHCVHAGLSDGKAVLLILMLAGLTGAYGVLGLKLGLPQVIITLSWIVVLLAHIACSNKPERYINFISAVFKRSK